MGCILNKEKIRQIKDIESRAYPPHMRTYEDIETPEDVKDYVDCDGDAFCHVEDGWYMLGCNGPSEVYVADLASARPLSFVDMNKVTTILRSMGEKTITAECRHSTSYRLIKLLEKRGVIEVMNDTFSHNWGSEAMREVEFRFRPQGFREWLEMNESMVHETLDPQIKTRLLRAKVGDEARKQEVIKAMDDEPAPYSAKAAFDRFNREMGTVPEPKGPASGGDVSSKADEIANGHHIEKYKQMLVSKQITAPMLYSLAFFAARGENEQNLDLIAKEMAELPKELRVKISFLNVPKITLGGTTSAFEDRMRFSGAVHTLAQSAVDHSQSAGSKLEFDPKIDIRPERQRDLVAEGGGIWIYRGSDPTMCRVYGKGGGKGGDSPWCVAQTSNTHHYFSYRLEYGQTQYFIFDTNKSADDPARRVNPGVAPAGNYSEWVDLRNSHNNDKDGNGFGVNGYTSIAQYKEYLAGNLGMSVEQLDTAMAPEPVSESEIKLKKYLDDYAAAS